MKKTHTYLTTFLLFIMPLGSFVSSSLADQKKSKNNTTSGNPVVIMKTSKGEIELTLYKDKAPITVKNFLKYVSKKSYDGTIFHRVIPDFMIQGGGFDKDLKKRETDEPIKNEAKNGLKNRVGTIAMARTNVVDSATNQFFINVKENSFLDHQGTQKYGYAVFGKVTKGLETVRKIEKVQTTAKHPHGNVPVQPVIIQSIRLKK